MRAGLSLGDIPTSHAHSSFRAGPSRQAFSSCLLLRTQRPAGLNTSSLHHKSRAGHTSLVTQVITHQTPSPQFLLLQTKEADQESPLAVSA